MRDLNSKAASIAAVSRRRFGLLLLLAFFLIVAAKRGLAQSTMASRGPIESGQGEIAAQHQQFENATNPGNGGYDSLLAVRRMKMLNNERRKSLLSDSDKLLKLATELNNEVAQTNSGSLTPDQLRKLADIEKLAHGVRDKMVMTIEPPSAVYFPVTGTQ